MQPSSLTIQLPEYEGPLDLLLDLIRRNQVKITEIPIAKITAQYLDYMQQALSLDMELSADFVYMASTLIHIKSRTLLPSDPELEKMMAEEDPRKELVNRLLQHERFKTAAEMLAQKRLIEEAVWSNPQIKQFASEDDSPGLAVGLFDLVKTLQAVVERVKTRPQYEIEQDEVSVPDMIVYLRQQIEAGPETVLSATALFGQQSSRRRVICLFLAILELVKRQVISLVQTDAFGDIGLRQDRGFDEVDVNAAALAEEYT